MRNGEQEVRAQCADIDRREDDIARNREFESLRHERDALVWEMRFAEFTGPNAREERNALIEWEREHAEEWNRVKPWYERRLA